MKAEIIAVGSELLTPDQCDTNSLAITARLNAAGFQVHFKSIVGDDRGDLAGLVKGALSRSSLIVISGGLGPTEDDVTREAVAKALGRPLVTNAEILRELRARFARRNQPMPHNNERQAEVIEGAEALPNAVGTAPGMWIEHRGARIVLLPGPPRELLPMIESSVMPRLVPLGGARRLATRSLRIIGLPESEVDAGVAPLYQQFPQVQTTLLAAGGYVGIRMQQWLKAGEDAGAVEELAARIRESLGSAVFTTSEESLEEVLGRLLRKSGNTLALAESCTGGMVGVRMTSIPGSSDYFLGGIICYSNEVKKRLCGVPEELLRRCGAVSAEVAEALARGVREALQSSIGISVTGIAGPGGGSDHKPVGLVYAALANADGSIHTRRIIPGDREMIRERSTYMALSLLRNHLLGKEPAA